MATRTKLSSKEISQIVADYQTAFPGWQLIGGDMLIRFNDLIGQSIWFDRLRTGAYRPTARVHVFAAPEQGEGSVVLPQFLDIKNREVSARSHPQQLSSVVNALKTEVVPSLIKELDANNIAVLLSSRAAGRPASAYALACLYAALGQKNESKRWIAEYQKAFDAVGLPAQTVDDNRAALLAKIEQWLDQSSSITELAAIAESEKAQFVGKTK